MSWRCWTRVSAEDAEHAATGALRIEDLDEESSARRLRLGFDPRGRLLEPVMLVLDSGNELVIHAVKARRDLIDLPPSSPPDPARSGASGPGGPTTAIVPAASSFSAQTRDPAPGPPGQRAGKTPARSRSAPEPPVR